MKVRLIYKIIIHGLYIKEIQLVIMVSYTFIFRGGINLEMMVCYVFSLNICQFLLFFLKFIFIQIFQTNKTLQKCNDAMVHYIPTSFNLLKKYIIQCITSHQQFPLGWVGYIWGQRGCEIMYLVLPMWKQNKKKMHA